jgi:hypothetical protein
MAGDKRLFYVLKNDTDLPWRRQWSGWIGLFGNKSDRSLVRTGVPAHDGSVLRTAPRNMPGLTFVQPRTGFYVASVHSIAERSLMPAQSTSAP